LSRNGIKSPGGELFQLRRLAVEVEIAKWLIAHGPDLGDLL